MGFGRRGRQETVTVTSFGEPEQITLRQLSAYDADRIRREYPPPLAPRKEADGVVLIDDKDDAYRTARAAWEERFLLLQLCAQVVDAEFNARPAEEQIVELCSSRTREEMIELATKAWMLGRGDMKPQHEEAAKERLIPTESAEREEFQT